MAINKPNIQTYVNSWFFNQFGLELDVQPKSNYESEIKKLKNEFESCEFWKELLKNLQDFNDQYYLINNEHWLLKKENYPKLVCKSYDSLIDKSYRKNIIENENFPDSPNGGWIKPEDWFCKIKDLVRTTIIVRYLDGVEFLVNKIQNLANTHKVDFSVDFEAREVGYYAAHITLKNYHKILGIDGLEHKILFSIEIQISTELQEAVKELTHKIYEHVRDLPKNLDGKKWQWNNQSIEFKSYYLGHILHYVDGMLLEAREMQKTK